MAAFPDGRTGNNVRLPIAWPTAPFLLAACVAAIATLACACSTKEKDEEHFASAVVKELEALAEVDRKIVEVERKAAADRNAIATVLTEWSAVCGEARTATDRTARLLETDQYPYKDDLTQSYVQRLRSDARAFVDGMDGKGGIPTATGNAGPAARCVGTASKECAAQCRQFWTELGKSAYVASFGVAKRRPNVPTFSRFAPTK